MRHGRDIINTNEKTGMINKVLKVWILDVTGFGIYGDKIKGISRLSRMKKSSLIIEGGTFIVSNTI